MNSGEGISSNKSFLGQPSLRGHIFKQAKTFFGGTTILAKGFYVISCLQLGGVYKARVIVQLHETTPITVTFSKLPTLSIPTLSTSHFVNSHFVNVDDVGIDEVKLTMYMWVEATSPLSTSWGHVHVGRGYIPTIDKLGSCTCGSRLHSHYRQAGVMYMWVEGTSPLLTSWGHVHVGRGYTPTIDKLGSCTCGSRVHPHY